jgi:hypothetical protein
VVAASTIAARQRTPVEAWSAKRTWERRMNPPG